MSFSGYITLKFLFSYFNNNNNNNNNNNKHCILWLFSSISKPVIFLLNYNRLIQSYCQLMKYSSCLVQNHKPIFEWISHENCCIQCNESHDFSNSFHSVKTLLERNMKTIPLIIIVYTNLSISLTSLESLVTCFLQEILWFTVEHWFFLLFTFMSLITRLALNIMTVSLPEGVRCSLRMGVLVIALNYS